MQNKRWSLVLALLLLFSCTLWPQGMQASELTPLTAEERAEGYGLYAPLGVAFKVAASYSQDPGAKRRHQGFRSEPEDLIRFSREYRYRGTALRQAMSDLDAAEMGAKHKQAQMQALRDQEIPLFGFFVINRAQMPESLEALAEVLGYAELRLLRENEDSVQVFAKGPQAPEGLAEEDKEAYETLYADIQVVEDSMRVFKAQGVEESLMAVESWQFEAEDLEGVSVDQSILEQAKLSYVVYWATWCPHCLLELSTLSWFEQIPMVHKELQIIGVVSNLMQGEAPPEDVLAVQEILDRHQVQFQNLKNSDALEAGLFKHVMNYPTSFFVDGTGRILKVYVGKPELQSLLEDARALLVMELGVAPEDLRR